MTNKAQAQTQAQNTKTNQPKVEQATPTETFGLESFPALGMDGLFAAGSTENQSSRLRDRQFPTAQRQGMAKKIGAAQGNNHLMRLVKPGTQPGNSQSPNLNSPITNPQSPYSPTPASVQRDLASDRMVQRAPGLPGGALMKIPYNYTKEIEINKGKYIKLSSVSFTIGGFIEELPGPEGDTGKRLEAGGTQTKSPKKDALQAKVEAKNAADTFFGLQTSKLSSSIKPYEKKAASVSRSDEEAKVGVSYEHGFEVEDFIVKGGGFSTAIEFNLLELKKNPGSAPKFHVLSAVPKVELSYKKDNFPLPYFSGNLKGEIAATFEPDWVTLGLLALETPIGWALAAAAGGAAIIYFSMKDMERRQDLAFKTRAHANAIARSAGTYGAVISGKDVSAPSGKFEKDAAEQAKADLATIVKPHNMTLDTYYTLVEVDNKTDEYNTAASSRYVQKALWNLEDKIEAEVKAWHSEHYIQSFFSGKYASDDMAMVRAIIAEAKASGGHGFLR